MFTLIMFLFMALLIAGAVYLTIQYNIELKKAQSVKPTPQRVVPPIVAVKKVRSSAGQWRSVRINAGLNCCKAAASMTGKIYLASAAPAIPLEQCNLKTCSCRYIHLEDRRVDEDRREESKYSQSNFTQGQQDRRRTRDRRVSQKT